MRRATYFLLLGALLSACDGGESTTTTSSGGSGGAGASGGTGGMSTGGAGASGGGGASTGGTGGVATGGTGGAGGTGGGMAVFPEILDEGVWLIGWSGGLDHFSWLRFDFSNATQGAVQVRESECVSCIGLFGCSGTGLFSADPAPGTMVLQLPMGCNNEAHNLTFGPFMPAQGFPADALMVANVTGEQGEMWQIYQYPEAACAADFSSCQDPFE